MSEYIIELDGKHSVALILALAEEMRGGDFVHGEIVRCRDCEHYHPELYLHIKCERHCLNVEPDDYCSYGERRPE